MLETRYLLDLVIYSGNEEKLICTLANEAALLKAWFIEGSRNLDQYTREVFRVLRVTTDLVSRGYND